MDSQYDFTATGWYALFDGPDAPSRPREQWVEAWSPDGDALVVDPGRGRLVVARTQPGFTRLVQCRKVTAVIPAEPGWRVHQLNPPEPPSLLTVIAWVAYQGEEYYDQPTLLPFAAGTGWSRGTLMDIDRENDLTLLPPGAPVPADDVAQQAGGPHEE